jgi:hypothetical protein
LLHQHFQLVKLGVAGYKVARQWRLVSKVELNQSQSKGFTVKGLQQLFTLMLPFELSDAGFLGNFSQLAPGFVTLRLETEGVALAVGHSGVVVRPRGVVRQGWIRGRRGGRIPLDEPEKKRIVRKRKKSGRNRKGSLRSLPPTSAGATSFRLVAGAAPAATTRHQVFGVRW